MFRLSATSRFFFAQLLHADAKSLFVETLGEIVLAPDVVVAADLVEEAGVLDALRASRRPHHRVGFAIQLLGLGQIAERPMRARHQDERLCSARVRRPQGARLRQRLVEDRLGFARTALLQRPTRFANGGVDPRRLGRGESGECQEDKASPGDDKSPASRHEFRKVPHREPTDPVACQFTSTAARGRPDARATPCGPSQTATTLRFYRPTAAVVPPAASRPRTPARLA